MINLVLIHNEISRLKIRFGLSFKQRMMLYRMLEKMTGEPAGLQINEAVIELQGVEIDKELRTPLWYMYNDLIEQMRSTDANFATSLAKYIPQQDVMIISAAEQDDITLGFTTVIDNNKKTYAMKQAFIQALAYPLFLICALLAVLYYFCNNLIPAMAQNIPVNAKLSSLSLFILALAGNFYMWFFALLGGVVLSILFIWWALPNFADKYRSYIEEIPPFNMYRLMVGCGFLLALNSLGKAGFMQIDALEQINSLARPYLRRRIETVMDLMADGLDIGQALIHSKLNFPDKRMIKELAIQMKYSDDNSLDILSATLAADGLETINRQAKILNTGITFLVFLSIGMLYFGIYGLGMDLGNI